MAFGMTLSYIINILKSWEKVVNWKVWGKICEENLILSTSTKSHLKCSNKLKAFTKSRQASKHTEASLGQNQYFMNSKMDIKLKYWNKKYEDSLTDGSKQHLS